MTNQLIITSIAGVISLILVSCGGPSVSASGAQESADAQAEPVRESAPQMRGRVVTGYQGWFSAQDDGTGLGYHHWGFEGRFGPGLATVEYWPDMSEAGPDEKYATDYRHADGSVAHVFSSASPATVRRHFEWMRDYGIGGAMLQRFSTELKVPELRKLRDTVLANVRDASATTGTPWAMMYDLSGLKAGQIRTLLLDDLRELIAQGDFRKDPHYLHHDGKPVIAIWGVGFSDGRKYSFEECIEMVDVLLEDPQIGGNAIMLGVPYWWRGLHRDATDDPRFLELLKKVQIVSPWSVGRLRNLRDVESREEPVLKQDAEWLHEHGVAYLPVVSPGFSWANLQRTVKQNETPYEDIPRLDGQFLWTQGHTSIRAGADMLYVAMFDEVDEGTAIFKVASNPPINGERFLTYANVPSDHYLWLTGQLQRMLRGETPLQEAMPAR